MPAPERRNVRLPPGLINAVQGAACGTSSSLERPTAGHAGVVGLPSPWAIRSPRNVARGEPAISAELFLAAICAVFEDGVTSLPNPGPRAQSAVGEFGSWSSL